MAWANKNLYHCVKYYEQNTIQPIFSCSKKSFLKKIKQLKNVWRKEDSRWHPNDNFLHPKHRSQLYNISPY